MRFQVSSRISGNTRSLREERGHSQDSFAHLAGYHRNYVGQLERGEKSPSLNAIFDFAKAVGLQPSEILKSVESRMVPGR